MSLRKNYYLNSFFWSTLQKILNAILGFISIPLLLGYYGKADYGILSMATAFNGYMSLLDLGMNTGGVKFFAQWLSEGKKDLVNKVVRTNVSFYIIISIINSIGLIVLALFGEFFFSVTHEQFQKLQICLYILAIFSLFSWITTAYNQLLVANKQMAFTMKVQSIQTILKAVLIVIVIVGKISLTTYFFWLSAIIAALLIPYAIECRRTGLIDSFKPAFYWNDFRVVLRFSLSIFALSLFQTSATQTRPILLSIFSLDGAETVADFRIIEVIPSFVIMIGGTFTGIFLPKTSEMTSKNNKKEMARFTYKWTILTTVIANLLCFPFIIGAYDILGAYVGPEFTNLTPWLVIWIVCTLLQIHSTPSNAMILADGKIKALVYASAIGCITSMIINAFLAKTFGVGSAVIGYAVYIIINLGCYYLYYYRKVLELSGSKILWSFLAPTICGVTSFIIAYFACRIIEFDQFQIARLNFLGSFIIKASVWTAIYVILLYATKILMIQNKRIITKYDFN